MDRYVLLYNFSMADSYIHLWIEATRLAACDFSRIEVTSSIG